MAASPNDIVVLGLAGAALVLCGVSTCYYLAMERRMCMRVGRAQVAEMDANIASPRPQVGYPQFFL